MARAPSGSKRVKRSSARRLRPVILLLLLTGLGFGMGNYGGRWLTASIALLHWPWQTPSVVLDALITPPGYTDLPPIVLASTESHDAEKSSFEVPEGSVLSVEATGLASAPVLVFNGRKEALTPDEEDRFNTTQTITKSGTLAIHRGWRTLASWRVHVVRDAPPHITFFEQPTTVNKTSTLLSYEASDDYGVRTIVAHISSLASGGKPSEGDMTVVLASPGTKYVKESAVQDLTFLPWAGKPVEIQLEARDAAGQTALSGKLSVTLPKRSFSHPLARALIEEREKLLRQPDEPTRDEAANIMAGIAHEMANENGDQLVYMALRTGAVRLVLDHDAATVSAVSLLLWQTAARIEDKKLGKSGLLLRQAQSEGG